MHFLIILPAIFGIVLCGNQSSGENKNFNFPNGAHGAQVNQNHGYNGNPIINYGNGGSSQGNGAAGAGAQNSPNVGAQTGAQNTGGAQGGSSQGNNDAAGGAPLAGVGNPRIIPAGGDSQDHDYVGMYGNIPAQSGGNQNANTNFGQIPAQGAGAGAGANSNDIDQAYGGNAWGAGTGGQNVNPGYAAPVAGGAEMGVMAHHEEYKSAGMSGAAVAGVVAGVVAVGAVGTGVAVYVLKSGASAGSPA